MRITLPKPSLMPTELACMLRVPSTCGKRTSTDSAEILYPLRNSLKCWATWEFCGKTSGVQGFCGNNFWHSWLSRNKQKYVELVWTFLFWNTPHPFFVSLPTLKALSGRKNSIMLCWGTRFNTGRPCRSPARGVATRTCPRPCRHVGSHSGWWQQLNIDQGSSLNSTPKTISWIQIGCLGQSHVDQAAIDILPKVLLSNHLVKPQIPQNLSNG